MTQVQIWLHAGLSEGARALGHYMTTTTIICDVETNPHAVYVKSKVLKFKRQTQLTQQLTFQQQGLTCQWTLKYLMICKADFLMYCPFFFFFFFSFSEIHHSVTKKCRSILWNAYFLYLKCNNKQMLSWYGCVQFITVHLYQNQEQFKLISLGWTVTFQETSF